MQCSSEIYHPVNSLGSVRCCLRCNSRKYFCSWSGVLARGPSRRTFGDALPRNQKGWRRPVMLVVSPHWKLVLLYTKPVFNIELQTIQALRITNVLSCKQITISCRCSAIHSDLRLGLNAILFGLLQSKASRSSWEERNARSSDNLRDKSKYSCHPSKSPSRVCTVWNEKDKKGQLDAR